MGYAMSGCKVVAANDIDPRVSDAYKANLDTPRHVVAPVNQFFEHISDLAGNIDILDGSPPCSTFSIAGSREDAWMKDKKFSEGQVSQVLSELFFEFLDLGKKLQPKVIVAENVKGMLLGKAKGYCALIFKELRAMGYEPQLFLLDASSCGVPQKRERVFFVARKKSLGWEDLKMNVSAKRVLVDEALRASTVALEPSCELTPAISIMYHQIPFGKSGAVAREGSFFNWIKLNPYSHAPTLATENKYMHPTERRFLCVDEWRAMSSFPKDYNFGERGGAFAKYIMGMSVPPLMAHCVSKNIVEQWFDGKA